MAISVRGCEEASDTIQSKVLALKNERDGLCRRLAKLCGIGIGLEGDPYAVFDACVNSPKCVREEERRQLTERIEKHSLRIQELEEAMVETQ